MMEKVSEIYQSGNYLNAKTVKGEKLTGRSLTVKNADVQTIGLAERAKMKLVLGFEEIGQQLVLNATNAKILAEAWGEVFTAWAGKKLQLFVTKTDYKGELVDSVQVVPM